MEMRAGWWYRRNDGLIARCVGLANDGTAVLEIASGSVYKLNGSGGSWSIKEHLPNCTGFDWKPQKTLGERLFEIATKDRCPKGDWRDCGEREQAYHNITAEAFLRDVLTPPEGTTLEKLLAAENKGLRNWDKIITRFLSKLTGIDL